MSQTNVTEYSVSELSGALKRIVETQFDYVRVRGEVSGYRGAHASGHVYFTLKDERARLDAIIWRGVFSKLAFKPEEGLEVIVTGKLSTYPGSSKYQILIETLEPSGAGAFMALLEERKKRLLAEKLFGEERKKPLPLLPRSIGVITSPTGAVIRDIVHRIADRFPMPVSVWPVRVQGETSAGEVIRAVQGFQALEPGGDIQRPDVLIIARGGGSIEDLWGFNDEDLVRAVAACDIPVISAIGHETDWTLLDLVADWRAPTPTGAAERVVPVKSELLAFVEDKGVRLSHLAAQGFHVRRVSLRAVANRLPKPQMLLSNAQQCLDVLTSSNRLERGLKAVTVFRRNQLEQQLVEKAIRQILFENIRRASVVFARQTPGLVTGALEHKRLRLEPLLPRLERFMAMKLADAKTRFAHLWMLLNSLSHRSVLERGYALVFDAEHVPVKSAQAVGEGNVLRLQFANGSIGAKVTAGVGVMTDQPAFSERASGRAREKTPPAGAKKQGQGELF